MALVTLSSSDLPGIIADATGEPVPEVKAEPEPKVEAKVEPKEDDEGEDVDFTKKLGVSKEQQAEFQKILRYEIGKKTRRAKEAEEFAESQYRERLLSDRRASELEERLKQAAPEKVAEKPSGEPKREAYETDEAFRSAIIEFHVEQRMQAREKQALEQRQAEVLQNASQRIATALELVPDYKEVTEAADYIVPGNIGILMQESPMLAELGYHFAKSPEDLGKLAILSPERAKVAFKEIEARMTPFADVKSAKALNGTKPSTDAVTASPRTDTAPSKPRAPAPITPLSTASSGQVVKDEADMNIREVITKYQKDKGLNLNRRQRH